ncbi:lipopolysaccharide biosynthesis protein [Breoghania sp.]|uniref:lipopolysaccharide biosynthesis protein n=1 Tax=Breoghania sp. TaxID=2065378 RepID=UPI002AA7B64A|nr:lipopolysaccharide biosynthesis protein [Breoghania sp.]
MKIFPQAGDPRTPEMEQEGPGKATETGGLVGRIRAMLGSTTDSAKAQRMALFTFGVRILGAVLAYVLQVFLARWMGSHEYGIYVVVWTLVIILGVIAPIGFNSAVQRLIPEYLATGKLDLLRGVLSASRIIAVTAATILMLTTMAVVWLSSDYIPAYYIMPAYLAALCLPMFTLTDVQEGIARARDWGDLAMLPTYIWRPLLIFLGALAASLVGFSHTATTICTVAIFATWLVALQQRFAMDRRLRSVVEPGPKLWTPGDWMRLSLPIFLVEGFFTLLTSADVLMVSYFAPPDEVAVYYAAAKTLALVHFVYYAVKAASAHRYSRFHHTGDHEGLAGYVRQSVRWTFWPSLACAGVLVLFGSYILQLFGKDFTGGHTILWVLMVGVLARASVGPVDALLTMAGEQKRCAVAYAMAFAVNVALNVTLIPLYGLIGAASATAISMCFEASSLFWVARRRLGIHAFIWTRTSREKPNTT